MLVAPIKLHILQYSIAFEKINGRLVSRNVRPCSFMPIRGAYARAEPYSDIDGLRIGAGDLAQVDMAALRGLVTATPLIRSLPRLEETANRGLVDYLALSGEPIISLTDSGTGRLGCDYAFGLLDGGSSLTLMTLNPNNWEHLFPTVRVYGDDSSYFRLERVAKEWEDRGKPDLSNATITVSPLGSPPAGTDGFRIMKKWMEHNIVFRK